MGGHDPRRARGGSLRATLVCDVSRTPRPEDADRCLFDVVGGRLGGQRRVVGPAEDDALDDREQQRGRAGDGRYLGLTGGDGLRQ